MGLFSVVYVLGLRNAAAHVCRHASSRYAAHPTDGDLVGMVDYACDLEYDLLSTGSPQGSASGSNDRRCHHAGSAIWPAPRGSPRAPTPLGTPGWVQGGGHQPPTGVDQLLARQRELKEARLQLE